MIIDASAVVAVVHDEEAREAVISALSEAVARAGSPTLLEAELVICGRRGPAGVGMVRGFVERFAIGEISFDQPHRRMATEAFLRYGKGRHPARLNFGDCMTYAFAKLAGEPLLCVGHDFARTDLDLVLQSG